MVALPAVHLEVNGVAITSQLPTLANLGSASSALPDGTEHLVLVVGNAADNDADVQAEVVLDVGGTPIARYNGSQGFAGGPAGALRAQQILAARVLTTGTGDTMQFRGAIGDADGDGSANLQALAIDITALPLDDGRYQAVSANTDTTTAGPAGASGWQTAHSLTFTPTRSGVHIVLASIEAVPDGAAGANEIQLRLTVDGTAVPGSTQEMNVAATPAGQSQGYLTFAVPDLAAASHTIAIQINGTGSAGNVDHRRGSIVVLEAALFEAYTTDEQSAGVTVATGGTAAITGIDTTLAAPAEARRILALACGPDQTGFWRQHQFALGDTPTLVTPGWGCATNDIGTGAGDDMMHSTGLYTADGVTTATRLRLQTSQFAPGNATTVVGQAAARASAGPFRLLALVLDVPDTGPVDIDLPAMADDIAGLSGTMSLQVEVLIMGDDELARLDGSLSLSLDLALPAMADALGGMGGTATMDVVGSASVDLPGMADALARLDGSATVDVVPPPSVDLPAMADALGGLTGSLSVDVVPVPSIDLPGMADALGGLGASLALVYDLALPGMSDALVRILGSLAPLSLEQGVTLVYPLTVTIVAPPRRTVEVL